MAPQNISRSAHNLARIACANILAEHARGKTDAEYLEFLEFHFKAVTAFLKIEKREMEFHTFYQYLLADIKEGY